MTSPAPRDLRRDLAAAVTILIALTLAVWSCVWGGPPLIFMWCSLILFGCAAKLGLREVAEPRPVDRPAPDDDGALEIMPTRGPDTT